MSFVIDIANSISGLPSGYQQAIKTAIDFFESTITTNMTVNLTFDWTSLGAGDLAENNSQYTAIPIRRFTTRSSDRRLAHRVLGPAGGGRLARQKFLLLRSDQRRPVSPHGGGSR